MSDATKQAIEKLRAEFTGEELAELDAYLAKPRQVNPDEVICPNCTHQFRAIPVNVQAEIAALKAERDTWKADAIAFGRQADDAEEKLAALKADPIIQAQHEETGRMWSGPHSKMPPRYFEWVGCLPDVRLAVAEQQIAALKADAERLRAVLRELYGYIERGELVRDISRDNANDWSTRMAKFALTLNKASTLLASEKE